MPKTDKNSAKSVYLPLWKYRLKPVLFVVALTLFSLTSVSGLFLYTRGKAQGATSSTLNFQARLLSNTGALVADGTYNIQFNLYTVATAGSTQWTENYLNSATQGVTLKDGFMSVNLGTITAFPSTINWDQEQWLGMTVRGTGSCAFAACTPTDAEMTPRFKLTAVPYAFQAGNALAVSSNPTTTASTNSNTVTVTTGNASGATSTSGDLNINTGTGTTASGNISLDVGNGTGSGAGARSRSATS